MRFQVFKQFVLFNDSLLALDLYMRNQSTDKLTQIYVWIAFALSQSWLERNLPRTLHSRSTLNFRIWEGALLIFFVLFKAWCRSNISFLVVLGPNAVFIKKILDLSYVILDCLIQLFMHGLYHLFRVCLVDRD